MNKTTIILFLFPSVALGQIKVKYSPQSVIGWGTTPSSTMVSVQYGPVGIMHITTDSPRMTDQMGNRLVESVTGVFAVPLQFESDWLNAGAGAVYFNKKAPTEAATKFNFYLTAGVHYSFDRFQVGIEYVHISNCWTGTINPGFDQPTLSFEINI